MKNFPSIDGRLVRRQRVLPESEWIHTCSVSGPYGITASVRNFAEVLDWQEHRRELTRGYYRLIHPPRVQEFKARLEATFPGWTAVLFTSARLAEKELRDFLQVKRRSPEVKKFKELPPDLPEHAACVLDLGLAGAVLLEGAEFAAELHERNRRRGGSVSARNIDALLGHPPEVSVKEAAAEKACTELLCEMEQSGFAGFFPSGMGAVTAVLDLALTPERPRMLVMGNVYRDTHLLLEEQSWAGKTVQTDFLDTDDLPGMERGLKDPSVCGVFLETVTNPLIEIPDLPRIAELCREAGKPLLVDSTMAGPLNVCPLELGASVVIHSTSKYLSGSNTHGGGVVLTRDPEWAESVKELQNQQDNRLSGYEFPVLLKGLETYPERLKRFNRNGEALADMLRKHPAVDTVFFANQGRPDWLKGLGSVVSCELKNPSIKKVERFFNADMPGVIKAPSLGSDQTLFCPYVLLAYYEKDDAYLRQCNLSKTLFRFAAGCEPEFDPVLEQMDRALRLTLD